jgi:DNA-binding HxlR family transcriptional regulator
MALGKDYTGQFCSLARSLEVIGERWTLLIVRDAFLGVRRFRDFAVRLEIPRAVLAARLKALVTDGVLERVPGPGGHDEYALTEKGLELWPVLRRLMAWGDAHYSPNGTRRMFRHAADDGPIGPDARCQTCGELIAPADIIGQPGPGYEGRPPSDDPALAAFMQTRRLLDPIRPAA